MNSPTDIEQKTGELFGNLFTAYDQENYLRSVKIFQQRFEDNGFDTRYFQGKKCLDVGCGGGRYSIALKLLGASSVQGVDIGADNITDARARATQIGVDHVTFTQASADVIPFENDSFDCIIFSGVLMHTENPEKVMGEISRVLKSGGLLYLLVYATEGVRWPLINILRNFSRKIGFENFDKALSHSGNLDVNKRRTFLDDLFVPVIDFYSEDRLRRLLKENGFENIDRWNKGRLDHEESLEAYLADLQKLHELYIAGTTLKGEFSNTVERLFESGEEICRSCVDYAANIIDLVEHGVLEHRDGRSLLIGQGHHRMTAIKK